MFLALENLVPIAIIELVRNFKQHSNFSKSYETPKIKSYLVILLFIVGIAVVLYL